MMKSSTCRQIPISRGGSEKVIQISKPEPPANTTSAADDDTPPEVPPVFTEMQRNMEDELERRRKDWEKEVERMQHDFFNIKTPTTSAGQLSDEEFDNVSRNVTVKLGSSPVSVRSPTTSVVEMNNTKSNFVDLADGSRMYRLRFDVAGFESSEVKVKAEGQKLFVAAWREIDHGNGHKSTKQFNRQIDIPDSVNPDDLVATVSDDGYLNIEGVVEETRRTPEPMLSPPHYYSVVSSRKRSPPGSPRVAPITPIMTPVSPHLTTTTVVGSPSRYGSTNPMVVSVNDTRKLKMAVDIGAEFHAPEVTIKVVGTKIQVHARHEETIGGRTSKREFSREFDLPERLEETTVRAVLGDDGKLVIGASVLSNRTHADAIDSVMRDMPINGQPVRVVVI